MKRSKSEPASQATPEIVRKSIEFLPSDVALIEETKTILNASSFVEAVRRSTRAMNELLKAQEAGGEIIVKDKGGKETTFLFVY